MAKKILTVIVIVVVFFAILGTVFVVSVPVKKPKAFGVTFSASYAENFGLNWQEVYIAVLEDLGIKKLRLPVYWREIERRPGEYNFSQLDWQLEQAENYNAEVILVLGRKVPRWPECHIPAWAKQINQEKQNQALLNFIKIVIDRYKEFQAIKIWQVENEPFLLFGECPEFSKKFFDEEIELVRSLDPPPGGRPVMVTDSGELSIWIPAAKRADIFGSTMYRTIWHPLLGTFTYPLPPSFFRFKRALTELFVGEKPMIIVELQAEPWGDRPIYEMSIEQQYVSMSPDAFRDVLEYASRSGFDTFYFWGEEWWYWLKEVKGEPEIWNIAKEAIMSVGK